MASPCSRLRAALSLLTLAPAALAQPTTSQTWAVNTGQTLTVNSPLGGAAGAALTKAGAGTLVLAGTNTFAGGATLSAGTVVLGSNTALGTGTVVLNGATVQAGQDVSPANA